MGLLAPSKSSHPDSRTSVVLLPLVSLIECCILSRDDFHCKALACEIHCSPISAIMNEQHMVKQCPLYHTCVSFRALAAPRRSPLGQPWLPGFPKCGDRAQYTRSVSLSTSTISLNGNCTEGGKVSLVAADTNARNKWVSMKIRRWKLQRHLLLYTTLL